jgi:hypothetical protein
VRVAIASNSSPVSLGGLETNRAPFCRGPMAGLAKKEMKYAPKRVTKSAVPFYG